MNGHVLLAVHAGATLMMAGLIWFVQVVHYPLFAQVGAGGFTAYEARHMRLTGWVVGPLMLAEAATTAWIAVRPPAGVAPAAAWLGLAMAAALWATTGLVQAPLHRRLARGFDARLHGILVRSNWTRTALWSGRGVLSLVMLLQAGQGGAAR